MNTIPPSELPAILDDLGQAAHNLFVNADAVAGIMEVIVKLCEEGGDLDANQVMSVAMGARLLALSLGEDASLMTDKVSYAKGKAWAHLAQPGAED